MRLMSPVLLPLRLAGCSTPSPEVDAKASPDVPCLHHQVFDLSVSFDHAMTVCRTPKPDLTGAGGLQHVALAARIPFTIRPIADTLLKQQAQLVTGSLIPEASAGNSYAPVFISSMPLSDGH